MAVQRSLYDNMRNAIRLRRSGGTSLSFRGVLNLESATKKLRPIKYTIDINEVDQLVNQLEGAMEIFRRRYGYRSRAPSGQELSIRYVDNVIRKGDSGERLEGQDKWLYDKHLDGKLLKLDKKGIYLWEIWSEKRWQDIKRSISYSWQEGDTHREYEKFIKDKESGKRDVVNQLDMASRALAEGYLKDKNRAGLKQRDIVKIHKWRGKDVVSIFRKGKKGLAGRVVL